MPNGNMLQEREQRVARRIVMMARPMADDDVNEEGEGSHAMPSGICRPAERRDKEEAPDGRQYQHDEGRAAEPSRKKEGAGSH